MVLPTAALATGLPPALGATGLLPSGPAGLVKAAVAGLAPAVAAGLVGFAAGTWARASCPGSSTSSVASPPHRGARSGQGILSILWFYHGGKMLGASFAMSVVVVGPGPIWAACAGM